MIGGTGDDLYIVNSTGDVVTEQAGGGTFDRVITSVSYTLGSNLEYLAMENGAGNHRRHRQCTRQHDVRQ